MDHRRPVARLQRWAIHPRRVAALRLSWCLVGAGVGLGLALLLVGPGASPFLLASLGGTTVFLFGLTQAPAAQPRALLGGHFGGAAIGIACGQCLGDALWVYALAQVLTLAWMLVTRTTHPPAGANPLIMIHQHAGWSALWNPVGLGLLALLAVAWGWSRVPRGSVRYPVRVLAPSPPSVLWGPGWPAVTDAASLIERAGAVTDVPRLP